MSCPQTVELIKTSSEKNIPKKLKFPLSLGSQSRKRIGKKEISAKE